MKELVGYLLDRETGVGISGKTVAFTKLDGSPVTSADTYWQDLSSSVTDSNGRFSGRFELSPGPINTKVTVSGSEVKIRKHDERAEFGFQWASDISRVARGMRGVVGGFKNELLPSCPAGHTIRIATGAAIFNGSVFSIENNYMDIAGTTNVNVALTTRIDLVTLRQYNEDAAGQLAGKQQVVVTLGSTNGVVPAVPTGADFVDYPIAEFTTGYNAATKTMSRDRRTFVVGSPASVTTLDNAVSFAGYFSQTTVPAAGADFTPTGGTWSLPANTLNADRVYDGYIQIEAMLFSYVTGIATDWHNQVGCKVFIDDVAVDGSNTGFWYGGNLNNDRVYDKVTKIFPVTGLTGKTAPTFKVQFSYGFDVGGTKEFKIKSEGGSRMSVYLKPR